jgi:hypothetical protein
VRQIEAGASERGAIPRKGQIIWSDASEERAAQSPRRGRPTGPPEPPAYGCGRRGAETAGAEEVEAGGKPHGAPRRRRRSPSGGFSEREEYSTCPRCPLAGTHQLNEII